MDNIDERQSPFIEGIYTGHQDYRMIGIFAIVIIIITIIVIIYTTSTSSSASISAPVHPYGNRYLGCYKDTAVRDLSNGTGLYKNKGECLADAEKNNAKYFGLQFREGASAIGKGQCYYGNEYNKYGTATNCSVDSKDPRWAGYPVGGSWSNSVYEV